METIKQTFAQCKDEGRAALVTYVTAGFPTVEETVDILLGMEAGGAGKRVHYVDPQTYTNCLRYNRIGPPLHRPDR